VRENLSFSICTCQLTVSNMGHVKDRCGKPFLPHRITLTNLESWLALIWRLYF